MITATAATARHPLQETENVLRMYGTTLAIAAAAALLVSCAAIEKRFAPPPPPKSTVEKIEDEAKKILDEIERKSKKE